ncbi:MAG: hypothetical protein H7255_07435 [Ramlibacter sp.]|nr:hypothetical protein [Ramlibacter sp.]
MTSVVNEVGVTGLRLQKLIPLMADTSTRFAFADLQAVLELDRRSTTKAVDLLVRTGYLMAGRSKPLRYVVTKTLAAALEARQGRPLSRAEAMETAAKLIRVVGVSNRHPEDSRILEVTFSGTILDEAVEAHPFVQAQVTVNVVAGPTAGIQMRRIEKTLFHIDKALHISLVLNST